MCWYCCRQAALGSTSEESCVCVYVCTQVHCRHSAGSVFIFIISIAYTNPCLKQKKRCIKKTQVSSTGVDGCVDAVANWCGKHPKPVALLMGPERTFRGDVPAFPQSSGACLFLQSVICIYKVVCLDLGAWFFSCVSSTR